MAKYYWRWRGFFGAAMSWFLSLAAAEMSQFTAYEEAKGSLPNPNPAAASSDWKKSLVYPWKENAILKYRFFCVSQS